MAGPCFAPVQIGEVARVSRDRFERLAIIHEARPVRRRTPASAIPSYFVTSPRLILAVPLRRLDQFIQRFVDDLLSRWACPLVTDHALVVDDVKRRRGGEVPLRCDRSRAGVARVDEGSPGYLV